MKNKKTADVTSISHFDVLRSLTQMAAISFGNLIAHLSLQALKSGHNKQIFEIELELFHNIPLFMILVVSVFQMVTQAQKDQIEAHIFFRG